VKVELPKDKELALPSQSLWDPTDDDEKTDDMSRSKTHWKRLLPREMAVKSMTMEAKAIQIRSKTLLPTKIIISRPVTLFPRISQIPIQFTLSRKVITRCLLVNCSRNSRWAAVAHLFLLQWTLQFPSLHLLP
jgi:hypothetical protein